MQLVEYRAIWWHENVYEEHFHLLSRKLYNHSIHTANILQMLATAHSFPNFCILYFVIMNSYVIAKNNRKNKFKIIQVYILVYLECILHICFFLSQVTLQ